MQVHRLHFGRVKALLHELISLISNPVLLQPQPMLEEDRLIRSFLGIIVDLLYKDAFLQVANIEVCTTVMEDPIADHHPNFPKLDDEVEFLLHLLLTGEHVEVRRQLRSFGCSSPP